MGNGTLEDYLNNEVMTEAKSCKIFVQILSVIEYLHNQDPPIIHRDLKPKNIMMGPNYEIKIVDFGVSNYDEKKINPRT